jgi:hypothetical protein
MNTRILFTAIAVSVSLIWGAPVAEACGCSGSVPSSVAFRAAEPVFVGTVGLITGRQPRSIENADGSISSGFGFELPTVTFKVTRVFRGHVNERAVIKGDGTDCDEPFMLGQAWLVYGRQRDAAITTDKCTRTRLLAEAGEDVKFLDGLEQGRPQAILYGEVFRQVAGLEGRVAQQALFEPLDVVAVGLGQRFVVTTDKWGPYQLVLPPGDFEVWVERHGQAVTARLSVRVGNGEARHLSLSAKFQWG